MCEINVNKAWQVRVGHQHPLTPVGTPSRRAVYSANSEFAWYMHATYLDAGSVRIPKNFAPLTVLK